MYKIQIFKKHPLEPRQWSNVYLVDTESLETATAAMALIYAAETAFHNEATTFDHSVASVWPDSGGVFISVPLNSPGDRADPADNLPLWNTLRVDLTMDGGGRPGRKYYRLPLGESDVANYVVNSGLLGDVKTTLDALIADLTSLGAPWVDNDVQTVAESLPNPRVQMRQLHRKRRRTVIP